MLEVRPGLLVGSMGDAEAVLSRVRSVTKRYTVTHILSVTNYPPHVPAIAGEKEGSGVEGAGGSSAASEEGGRSQGDSLEGEGEGDGGGSEEGGRSKEERKGAGGKRKKVGGQIKAMCVKLPDMPSSDLLHHFEPCVKFIKEGVEQGTILVHCGFGISRSVTMVLAYLMWAECLPFKVAFEDLKKRKPEARPNPGFIEQLKLWETMRCRIDENNKAYKAYRLQHKAKEMKEMGYLLSVGSSPDPSLTELDSSAYFRCRKCRRLLFTDESVLQHELGEGQAAFRWNKRSKPAASSVRVMKSGMAGDEPLTAGKEGDKSTRETEDDSTAGENDTLEPSTPLDQDESSTSTANGDSTSPSPTSTANGDSTSPSPTSTASGDSTSPSTASGDKNPSSPSPTSIVSGASTSPTLTPADVARVREQVATVVAMGNHSTPLIPNACSSYFIEPVEWMETQLLGHVEGKILCPKCNARLGSFNWAGEQCSCGQWVTPSFQIHRNRVDETRTLSRRKNIPQQT